MVIYEQMRIIHLSTRSVTYSDPEMRYVARLHDLYLENKEKSDRRQTSSTFIRNTNVLYWKWYISVLFDLIPSIS